MRRADRLFHIVQLIRGRRQTTAQWLAQRLEVSERTVYRDVADLQYQGVPIEGEAGVGYRLGKGFELPPLIFTVEEVRALVAWCNTREDFRTFRIDRIMDAQLTDQTVDLAHSKSLPAYMQRHGIKLEDL